MNDLIMQFITLIDQADITDDAMFHGIIQDSEHVLGLSDREFAYQFRVSVPTVTRWRNGVSRPHPLARKGIYKFLIKKALEK